MNLDILLGSSNHVGTFSHCYPSSDYVKCHSQCPVLISCNNYVSTEIRPAPHMDNLVRIYKTMEVASGVSIHVTQSAPTKATGNTE